MKRKFNHVIFMCVCIICLVVVMIGTIIYEKATGNILNGYKSSWSIFIFGTGTLCGYFFNGCDKND